MEAIEECGRLGVPVVTALANGFSETGAEGTAREARIGELLQGIRHTARRSVEPRRGRPAAQGVSHRQRRVRRARPAGRPHLRGIALRRHDRHVAVARQGARHSFRRPRLGRQRGRSVDRRDLRRRRSTIPASTATCCSSKPCGRRRRCAPSRSRPPSAASRCWPTSSAARPRRASLRCRTPARSRARTIIAGMFLAECGIARVDTLEGLIEGFPLLARVPAVAREAQRPTVAVVTTTAGGATMVVDPLATRGIAVEPPTPQTLARIKAMHRRRRDAGADHRSDARRRAVQCDEGRARCAHHRARVRSGRGRGRLLGAVLSRSRGQADHRQRRRRKADRGVSRARGAGRAGAARRRRRAEFPYAGSLRRRGRRRVAAARATADRGASRQRSRRRHVCSTSWRPMRCSTASACRMRRRSRSTASAKQAPALPFRLSRRGQGAVGATSRTSPMSAAWC